MPKRRYCHYKKGGSKNLSGGKPGMYNPKANVTANSYSQAQNSNINLQKAENDLIVKENKTLSGGGDTPAYTRVPGESSESTENNLKTINLINQANADSNLDNPPPIPKTGGGKRRTFRKKHRSRRKRQRKTFRKKQKSKRKKRRKKKTKKKKKRRRKTRKDN